MGDTLQIAPRAWSSIAASALAEALDDDLAQIKAEVDAGRAQLWQVFAPGAGWLVTRLEVFEAAPTELVLVAGAGEGYRATVPLLREVARRQGAERVRIHTHRPGICRWLQAMGAEELERVYILNV